jgi:TATA-box binding protein (TBP) (component of TFIID and TFIIIB)
MDLKDFVGKPCTTKISYEFFPKNRVEINLELASNEINTVCEIEVCSKVLLIGKIENKTISIFKNGKIVVRGEKEETTARKIAEKICKKLDKSVKIKKGLFGF